MSNYTKELNQIVEERLKSTKYTFQERKMMIDYKSLMDKIYLALPFKNKGLVNKLVKLIAKMEEHQNMRSYQNGFDDASKLAEKMMQELHEEVKELQKIINRVTTKQI